MDIDLVIYTFFDFPQTYNRMVFYEFYLLIYLQQVIFALIQRIGVALIALATAVPYLFSYLYYIAPDFAIKFIIGIVKSYTPRWIISSLLNLWIILTDRAGERFVAFLGEHGNHSPTCESIAR